MTIEHKANAAPALKLSADGPGTLSGYASTFGNLDSDGDIVQKGAYRNTVTQFLRKGFVSWGHDWAKQIATPSVLREDDHGLYVEAAFHSDPESQAYRTKVKERLERGLDVALSIGYRVRDAERQDGARLLKDLELYEWSIVPVPANAEASLLAAKGEDYEEKRPWDSSYISSLPDSAFAVVLPGGKKDGDGKTVPRSLRKLPHHNANGSIDLPHLRNALSRLPQSKLPGAAAARAGRHLAAHAKAEEVGQGGKELGDMAEGVYPGLEAPEGSYEDLAEDISEAFSATDYADEGDDVCTVATFPGGVAYVCVSDPMDPIEEPAYYRVLYDVDPDTGDPVLGAITPVEASIAFTPVPDQQPGMSFAGQAERALAACTALTARTLSLADRRAKEGRTFSAANIGRMTTILRAMRDAADELDRMLGEAAPPPKAAAADPAAIRRAWLQTQGRLLALQETAAL